MDWINVIMSALLLLMVYKYPPMISKMQDQYLEANSHQFFRPYGFIYFRDTPSFSHCPFPLFS